MLCLQNRYFSEEVISAFVNLLKEWTQEISDGKLLRNDKVLIEELIIDDCAFKDNQLAIFLQGIGA